MDPDLIRLQLELPGVEGYAMLALFAAMPLMGTSFTSVR